MEIIKDRDKSNIIEIDPSSREKINKGLASIHQNDKFKDILDKKEIDENYYESTSRGIKNFKFLKKDTDVKELFKKAKKSIFCSFNDYDYKYTELATTILDLKTDVWSRIKKDQRKSIRKARKNNVSITFSEEKRDWDYFKEILLEIQQRKGHYFGKDVNKMLDIIYDKKDLRKMIIAKMEGKMVGGGLFLLGDKFILSSLFGIKEEYYRSNPMVLIIWSAIEWGMENGFEYFDFGGVTLNPKKNSQYAGINMFKLKFGGGILKYKVYYPQKHLYYLKKIKDMVIR